MIGLAYYCSYHRNQVISFYFTVTFTAGFFVLDTTWRNTLTCWYHPWLKMDYYFVYLQMFMYWITAKALWTSIHPYALTLAVAVENPLRISAFMKAESDFYNVITLCEIQLVFIDTFAAMMIVWTQVAYHRIRRDEKLGKVPYFVSS